MDEKLEATCRSVKESEEQSADLHESIKKLFEEVSLAIKKSSEVERLLEENKEEQVKPLARCNELETEVRLQAECTCKVSLKVLKQMKEDYLALEEFQDEKIDCATDRFLQGFDECIHQLKELDPNFDVAHLKRGDEPEDKEEEEGAKE